MISKPSTAFLLASGLFGSAVAIAVFSCTAPSGKKESTLVPLTDSSLLMAPDEALIPDSDEGALIKYGKDLIVNTARYLGPKGAVAKLSNGMNCQNCHLQAGQKTMANGYFTVAATYPRFSPRSGGFETVAHKVNDCMERSLNGKKLDTTAREMQAMVAFIKWVGSAMPKGIKPAGGGTVQLAFMPRPADTTKGENLYAAKCRLCHGAGGQGLLSADSSTYVYPPLWGPHSYNVSAGIFRLSKLAGFIKANMPFGVSYKAPQLSDEEAWDVAAFINSQPRNQKKFLKDWPVLFKKPVDYPFAPYYDSFSESRHKYGPFIGIAKEAGK